MSGRLPTSRLVVESSLVSKISPKLRVGAAWQGRRTSDSSGCGSDRSIPEHVFTAVHNSNLATSEITEPLTAQDFCILRYKHKRKACFINATGLLFSQSSDWRSQFAFFINFPLSLSISVLSMFCLCVFPLRALPPFSCLVVSWAGRRLCWVHCGSGNENILLARRVHKVKTHRTPAFKTVTPTEINQQRIRRTGPVSTGLAFSKKRLFFFSFLRIYYVRKANLGWTNNDVTAQLKLQPL